MNSAELVDKLASDTGLSKSKVSQVLKSFTTTVTKQVQKGSDVRLVGFGTFKRITRQARKGRNPQTGATVKIPSRKAPKFIAGRNFKEAVSGRKSA